VKAVILAGGLGTRLAETTVCPKRTTNSSIPAAELDTVEATMNGGRLRRGLDYLDDEDFCLPTATGWRRRSAWFGVLHREQGGLATVTGVQPPGRFGALNLDQGGQRVAGFDEKARGHGAWRNGGFFVLSPRVGRYLPGDATMWGDAPLRFLAQEAELACFRHLGFCQAMDTVRDRTVVEGLWESGRAPWHTWA